MSSLCWHVFALVRLFRSGHRTNMQREAEQAKLDKDVLDKGLDEAMKELRQQSQQLAVARDLASEARDLAAQV